MSRDNFNYQMYFWGTLLLSGLKFFAPVILIALFVIFLMTPGCYRSASYEGRETWPSVMGTLDEFEVDFYKQRHRTDAGETADGFYYFDLKYRYVVNGQAYIGNRFSFPAYESNEKAKTDAIAKQMKVGKPIEVFYSPTNPAACVLSLETGHSADVQKRNSPVLTLIILLVIFLGCGCLLYLKSKKKYKVVPRRYMKGWYSTQFMEARKRQRRKRGTARPRRGW
ncbi:DUF3592 domain-containing protein [Planctomycetota bacterium]|nr:DUF3592 domain-containing protein [Planctomycetota bacterium]